MKTISYKELLTKSLKELKEIVLSEQYPIKTKEYAWRVALMKTKRNWK
ncbi:MAG: hypothetical protein RL621_1618 [Bacteroidota bacterium]|jgi:hypothetical protein